MKRLIAIGVAVAALSGICGGVALAAEGERDCPSLNLNVIGARKSLEEAWEPNDQQDELGVNVDVRGAGWPFSIDLAYLVATQEGRADTILDVGEIETSFDNIKQEATTEELSAGLKRIWTGENNFSFFLGGGATWVRGDLDFLDIDKFSDSELGWYATTGAYYTIVNLINIGIIGRYSDVKVNLTGDDVNAGGWHYGAFAGLHF